MKRARHIMFASVLAVLMGSGCAAHLHIGEKHYHQSAVTGSEQREAGRRDGSDVVTNLLDMAREDDDEG